MQLMVHPPHPIGWLRAHRHAHEAVADGPARPWHSPTWVLAAGMPFALFAALFGGIVVVGTGAQENIAQAVADKALAGQTGAQQDEFMRQLSRDMAVESSKKVTMTKAQTDRFTSLLAKEMAATISTPADSPESVAMRAQITDKITDAVIPEVVKGLATADNSAVGDQITAAIIPVLTKELDSIDMAAMMTEMTPAFIDAMLAEIDINALTAQMLASIDISALMQDMLGELDIETVLMDALCSSDKGTAGPLRQRMCAG